jgi:hypothetical protein
MIEYSDLAAVTLVLAAFVTAFTGAHATTRFMLRPSTPYRLSVFVGELCFAVALVALCLVPINVMLPSAAVPHLAAVNLAVLLAINGSLGGLWPVAFFLHESFGMNRGHSWLQLVREAFFSWLLCVCSVAGLLAVAFLLVEGVQRFDAAAVRDFAGFCHSVVSLCGALLILVVIRRGVVEIWRDSLSRARDALAHVFDGSDGDAHAHQDDVLVLQLELATLQHAALPSPGRVMDLQRRIDAAEQRQGGAAARSRRSRRLLRRFAVSLRAALWCGWFLLNVLFLFVLITRAGWRGMLWPMLEYVAVTLRSWMQAALPLAAFDALGAVVRPFSSLVVRSEQPHWLFRWLEAFFVLCFEIACLFGLWQSDLGWLRRIRPSPRATSTHHVLLNTALVLLMANSMPAVTSVLGLCSAELRGVFSARHLQQPLVVLVFNALFLVSLSRLLLAAMPLPEGLREHLPSLLKKNV